MERQDLNGYRKPQDVVQAFDLSKIELNSEDIEKIKQEIICDDHLSTTSKAPVQNKVVTNALNNKVTKETGKGLSEENYTTTEKTKLSGIDGNAEENKIDTIKVNGVTQTITNKTVDLTYSTVYKKNSSYSDAIELSTDTKEIYLYCSYEVSGYNHYLINLGHYLINNFVSGSNYYLFNTLTRNTHNIQCNVSLVYGSTSIKIYVTDITDNGTSVAADTTLYVDYR